jgi:hypothetical protein
MIRALLCLLLLCSACQAQNEAELIKQLTQADSKQELDTMLVTARELGLPEQILTEAKLTYGLRREDSVYLKSLLPELERAITNFKRGQSGIALASVDQFRGLVACANGIIALDDGQTEVFKQRLQEAVWLFPEQASFIGRSIVRYQLMQRLSRQSLDLTSPLPCFKHNPISLSDISSGAPGQLLIFWSAESKEALEQWKSMAPQMRQLTAEGFPASGVMIGQDKEGQWKQDQPIVLLDTDQQLSRALEISYFPTAVLLSAQGRVLYHGHPFEPGLWRKVRQLAPATSVWRQSE